MPFADLSFALGGGGGREQWWKRLAGQCPAFTQILRFGDSPAGLVRGDVQQIGYRTAQWATEFFRAGLRAELIDQRVLRCAQPARHTFQALQRPLLLRSDEYVKGQPAQSVQALIEEIQHLADLLTSAGSHV